MSFGIRRTTTKSWLSWEWVNDPGITGAKWVTKHERAMSYRTREEAMAAILKYDLEDEPQPRMTMDDPEGLVIEELP